MQVSMKHLCINFLQYLVLMTILNSGKIYEARQQLLDLKEVNVKAEIPQSYQLMDSPTLYDRNSNLVKGKFL